MKRDGNQWDLFGDEPQKSFGGETFDHDRDFERLNIQLGRVYRLMADGHWRSLAQIQAECGGSEAAVSARLRDLRKPQFGGHEVQRVNVHKGLWRYRLVVRRDG